MLNKSFSKQLPINLISTIGVFSLSTFVGLFMTPFLIKYVGIDGLGIIKLASTVPAYIGLLTLVISGSVSRFLSINLNNSDMLAANKTFNTAFFSMAALLFLLVPFIFIFSYNISHIFKISSHLEMGAVHLFLGILLAALISLFSALFMLPAFASNRLDVSNFTKIATVLFQTILIVVLLIYFNTPFSSVGIAYFLASLLGLIVSVKIWKHFSPFLTLTLKYFDFSTLKEFLKMGSWLVVDQMGTILFLYVDLLVVNYVFGEKATGEYAIPLQWQTLLRSLASVLAGVITPMILISYARKEYAKIINLSYISVKFLGLALAIPIGLIAGFAPSLLRVWVGKEFVYLSPLMWLIILPMGINLAFSALYSINTAYNRIKVPAYITLLTGVASLILAILFTMYLDFGLYGVALAGVIAFTGRNLFFSVFYAAYLTGANVLEYYKRFLLGVVVTAFIFIISQLIQQYTMIENWSILLVWMSSVTICILPIIWVVMITSYEKQIILKMLQIRK